MDCDEFDRVAGLPGDDSYDAYIAIRLDCEGRTVDWRTRCLAAEAEVARLTADVERLTRERDEALRSRQFTQEWYGTRWEVLADEIRASRDLAVTAKTRFFSIIANGTPTAQDPPTYAQQLNRMKWRAEAAEKERDAAREALSMAEGRAFAAGYDAGWESTGEGHNAEYTRSSFTQERYEAGRAEALDEYRRTREEEKP